MIRYLLLFLFFIMFAGRPFGLGISLALGLSSKNLFLYLLVSIFALQTAVKKNRKLEALPVLVPYGLLLGYGILSYTVVIFLIDYPFYDKLAGAISLKNGLMDHFLMLLIFFYGTTDFNDTSWLIRKIVWLVILGNVLTLAAAFGVPGLGMLDLEMSLDGRLQGFIGQSAQFGAFIGFFLPGTIALFVSESGIKRVLSGIGVVATFVCLLLAFSRGAYVGVIGGALFASYFLRRYISLRAVTVAAIAVVIACVVAVPLLFIAGYGHLFIERFSLLQGDAYTLSQGRSTIWLNALSVMTENPVTFITGYGWRAYENFREFSLITHNVYLNHLFNIGSIGLLLFLSILIGVLTLLRRAIYSASGAARSFIISTIFGFSALCVSMFFAEVYAAGVLVWAYVGLMLRIAIESESRRGATRTTEPRRA